MALTQTEILQRAERLAGALAGGATRVERNVLLAVVGDFMSDRQPDPATLRRTLKLLAEGSGGQLRRAGSYAEQIRTVAAELPAFLDEAEEEMEPEDYRSLFGWTARLLLVPGAAEPARVRGARRGGEAGAAAGMAGAGAVVPGRPGGPGGPGPAGSRGGAGAWPKGTRGPGRGGRPAGESRPQAAAPPAPSKLAAVGTKGLSALMEVKRRLEEQTPEEQKQSDQEIEKQGRHGPR